MAADKRKWFRLFNLAISGGVQVGCIGMELEEEGWAVVHVRL